MAEMIEIEKIVVEPERIRQHFEDLDRLAQSIENYGLLQPILIDRQFRLVAGERRLRAHLDLGKAMIRAEFSDEVEEWKLKAMELEENIQRQELTYQEEVEAKLRIHDLYQERYGKTVSSGTHGGKRNKDGKGWTIAQTAELLGDSHGLMVEDLQLAQAIRDNPDLGKKETKEAAKKALKVGKELGFKRELAQILAGVAEEQGDAPIQVIWGDSREVLKKFEDDTFDWCVTDPPYGIGLHDIQDTFPNRGEVRQGVAFDDKINVLEEVVRPVMAETYRVLKEGAHCYVFFAIARYTEVRKMLEEVGFWLNPAPIFWIKNNALNLRPWLVFPINYEPCFQCAKGYPPRPFPKPQLKSTFEYPILSGIKKVHPAEKPVDFLKEIIGWCSEPQELGLDPFAGGGSTGQAAKEMGRRIVEVELDQMWWLSAKERVEGEPE